MKLRPTHSRELDVPFVAPPALTQLLLFGVTVIAMLAVVVTIGVRGL